jgi:hypothetical protein
MITPIVFNNETFNYIAPKQEVEKDIIFTQHNFQILIRCWSATGADDLGP